ncbi:MAG TPA: ketosteroid isomerase-related protein [Rudaea sp.]|nr:ketosteroid isomerase-related protein [Rudaea sp.]
MIIDGARAADRTSALILRYYAALNRGDVEGMLDCVADDVIHDINQGTREHGKTAFESHVHRALRSYREELRDIVVMCIDDGTRAAAEFTIHGTYQAAPSGMPPAQGQRYCIAAGAFFVIHQGRIARLTQYHNDQERQAQISRGG